MEESTLRITFTLDIFIALGHVAKIAGKDKTRYTALANAVFNDTAPEPTPRLAARTLPYFTVTTS